MILLNYAHPITPVQRARIEELTGQSVTDLRTIPVNLDTEVGFESQVLALVDAADLSANEWQSMPILVNPPALNFAAVMLVAELHGRMGHFPTIVRIRPVENATPTRYEVAEIVDLQAMRTQTRASSRNEESAGGEAR